MAFFGGYPQTVNFQTVNVSAGGGSENLLINPRGKINQAGEADGVLAAGQYFCDGWKAGANGAEVYIDDDGFRLISGSILQLVPNNLEAGRTIRGNMDTLNGTPVISINGGGDNVQSDNAAYIQFEVSGDNSKFTRIILAESIDVPIYQQSKDELSPCQRFLLVKAQTILASPTVSQSGNLTSYGAVCVQFPFTMALSPAMTITGRLDTEFVFSYANKQGFVIESVESPSGQKSGIGQYIADARP